MKPKVLVSNKMMLLERDRFEREILERGWCPVFAEVDQFLSEEECLRFAGEVDGWLAGDDKVTRRVLENSQPRLKGVAKWGTGLDSFDLIAAAELGVPVLNSPGAFADAVSEVALGYMLMLTRHLAFVDRQVRLGGWPKPQGLGLSGRTCGVFGYGAIGRAIAERAAAFNMRIIFSDPKLEVGAQVGVGVGVSVPTLVEMADVLVLACNLTPENRHLIDERMLSMMKKDAVLINVARGGLVDEGALCNALSGSLIAGAALDVFEIEPLPGSSFLRRFENVVLGSHNANNMKSTVESVHRNTLQNMETILRKG